MRGGVTSEIAGAAALTKISQTAGKPETGPGVFGRMQLVARNPGLIHGYGSESRVRPATTEKPARSLSKTPQPTTWRVVACAGWLILLGLAMGVATERFYGNTEIISVASPP